MVPVTLAVVANEARKMRTQDCVEVREGTKQPLAILVLASTIKALVMLY
jgi:hypothetical protein